MNKKWIGNNKEFLRELPDNCVQAVIADPPYDLNDATRYWYHQEFRRVCKGVIMVFCPPENQWTPIENTSIQADQYLFWIKPISTKNTSQSYSRFVEMILVYGHNVWNSKRHWSQYPNVFNDLVDSREHPYRKPPSLIERLILNHTNPDDIILDPFAGTFVVADMADRNGRNYLSIEREDHYGVEDTHLFVVRK